MSTMPSAGGGGGGGGGSSSAGADDETLREIFSEYVNFGSYTRTADTVDCTRFTRMVRHLVLVDRHTRLTLQDADIAFHQVCRRGGAGSATRRLDYDGFISALLLLAPVAFPHLHPEQGLAALTDTMSYVFLSSRHRRTLKRSDKAAKQQQRTTPRRSGGQQHHLPTSLDRVLPRHSEAPPPGLFDESSVVSGASTSAAAPHATSPHPHPPPPPSFPTPPFAFPFPPPPPPPTGATGAAPGAAAAAAALFGGGMPPPPPPPPAGMMPGGAGFPPPFPFGIPPHPSVFQGGGGVPPTPASPTEQGLSVDGGVEDLDSYDEEEVEEEDEYAEEEEYARGAPEEGGLGWSAANDADADDYDASAALLQAGKRRSVSFQVPPQAAAPSEAYLEVRQPLPLSGGGSLEEKLALEKRGRTSAGRTKVPRPGYHTAHTAVPTFRINTRYSTRASRMSDYHGKEVVDGMRRLKMIAEDESRQLPAAATAAAAAAAQYSAANSSAATILSGSTRSSGGGGGGGGGGRPLSTYHFP
eukprot:Rhum_TRINITY_DN11390_c0_g1::Rhum_TRINITY_DN11390_c0_g1_i1::g.44315::m.44315